MSKVFNDEMLHKLNNPKRIENLRVDDLLNLLSPGAHDLLLDVGAGTGLLSLAFAKAVKRVDAIDLSAKMCHYLSGILREKAVDNVRVINKPLESLVKEPTYHIILLSHVFHELPDQETFMKELSARAHKGAVIAFLEWKKEDMKMGPPIHHRVSPQEIINKLPSSWTTEVHEAWSEPFYLMLARKE